MNLFFKMFCGVSREQTVKRFGFQNSDLGHQNGTWGKGRLGNVRTMRIALSALSLIFTSSQALAYDVTKQDGATAAAEPYKTIATQASEFVGGDSLVLGRSGSPAFAVGDTVEISLSGGATFADSAIVLENSRGGAGTGAITDAVVQTGSPTGKSTIRYTLADTSTNLGIALGFIMSGSTIAGQRVNFNLPPTYGTDIYITFTVRDAGSALKGSVRHLLFDSTLAPSASEAQSQREIQNVLGAHARNLTSQSVGLSGLLTGRGFGGGSVSSLFGQSGPVSTALAATTDISLPVSMEMTDGQGNFAASLNQLKTWDGSLGIGDRKSSSKPPSQLVDKDSPFNVWVKGRWQGVTDRRGGTNGEGDFGLLMTGADYRYRKDTLIGLLAQYDFYDKTSTGQSAKAKGHGWMFGPYLVTRPVDNLIWDARIAWGSSKNMINQSNFGWDHYVSERWQVETNLTGEMEYQGWDILPQLGMNYFGEKQRAYRTHSGTKVGSQSIALGNLSFGPEVSRSTWEQFEGVTVRPFAALRGIWDFKSPSITHNDGRSINTERLRARAELGADAAFTDGRNVHAKYAFDGIGVAGYEAHSLELVASAPVNFGFFPNGSHLKSSLNQSVSEVSASQFKLSLDVPLN